MSESNTAESQYHPDRLDLGILECLAHNCRLAHSCIAEALGVASNTVTNRILGLEKEGIIRQYAMMCDLRPFGFVRSHVLLKFGSKSHDLYAQCRALGKSPSAVWIPSYIGAFDTQVIVETHERMPMSEVLNGLFALCVSPPESYALFTEMVDLEFTHCLPSFRQAPALKLRDDGSFSVELSQRSAPLPQHFQRTQLSELDIALLEVLAEDPRAGLSALAASLGCDRQTVRRRMLQLIQKKIILSFGVGFDFQRLGYTAYHLLFKLRPGLSLDLLYATFRKLEGIYYAGTAHGAYDLSVYLFAASPQHLSQIVQRIRKAFGTHVTHYDLLVYDRVHYWKQFSPAVVKTLRSQYAE